MHATPPSHDDPAVTPTPPVQTRKRRWPGALLALAITAGLVGGGYYLIKRQQTGAAAGARGPGGPGGPGPGGPGGARVGVTVGIATAKQGELPIVIDALGTVVPSQSVSLTAQVSGVLQDVLFQEGQLVKKGELLARIDPRTYEQALQQAKAQTARDQAQLIAAQQTLKRYETLWQQDSIAKQDVDTQAALVKQLQATVQADQASEKSAQINLDYTRITAPLSGRIGLRNVDPGNLVANSTTAIATIAQISPVDVTFAVPQDRVPDVLTAQQAATLPATALDRGRTQTLAIGKFLTLDNSVDTATGTVKAKARFDNADYKLFPNQFVNVSLRLGATDGVLVPVSAVRLGPNGNYVYAVDDEQVAHMRLVSRGASTSEWTQVISGLQAGERVVTEGGDRVKDGGKVQLASDKPMQGASRAGRGMRGKRGGASAPAGSASQPRASAPAASAAGMNTPPAAGPHAERASAGAVPAAKAATAAPETASSASMGDFPPNSRRESQHTGQNTNQTSGPESGQAPRRLPPDVAAKLATMSDAERDAFMAERRAAREARRAAAAASDAR